MSEREKCQAFVRQYPYSVKQGEKLPCTMKVGGPVDLVVKPGTEEEIVSAIELCRQLELPYVVLGKLSNTIVRDGGYRGLVIQLGEKYSGLRMDGKRVTAKAGTPLIHLAQKVTEAGLSGLEFAGGIPGSLGGGVVMNAGAYGGQISDVLTKVKLFDGVSVQELSADQLHFDYRHSLFMAHPEYCVLEAAFTLSDGGDMALLQEYNRRRKEKQPLELPNCGSVFKRPPGHYAGKLIMDCGLQGESVGGAQVSTKHSGFIVNTGGATAADVLCLMQKVRDVVLEKTGIALENEWFILGEEKC